ncbi:MAG: DUF11 domain-containing protein [Novipirellula sp. JB048]
MNQSKPIHTRQDVSVLTLAIALLVGAMLMGCQSPIGAPAPIAAPPAMAPQTAAPPPPTAMSPPSSALPSSPGVSPPVRQVGWQHHGGSAAYPARASACGCVHGGGTHGGALPGAARHAGAAGQTGAHGYATYAYGGWNAHGVDANEFLCNGGDHPPHVAVRQDETLAGLDPEDTVVHYTTEAGDIEINSSNRVCVYAPRFASVRKITGAVAGGRTVGLAGVQHDVGLNRIHDETPGLVINDTTAIAHADVARRIDAMRDRNRGVRVEGVLQPEIAEDVLAALAGLSVLEMQQLQENQLAIVQASALAAQAWSIEESIEVAIEDMQPPTLSRDLRVEEIRVYDFPAAGRLQVSKFADRQHAQPGERVTFAIRIENVGDSAVGRVTLTDNLTTRLEYVPESQTCSGGAEFTSDRNEAESLTLQWRLTDELKVGESVTIRFQCKVR